MTATFDGPAEGAPASGASPPPPSAPITVPVEEDGDVLDALQADRRRWSIIVTALGSGDKTTSLTRTAT